MRNLILGATVLTLAQAALEQSSADIQFDRPPLIAT